MSGARDPGAATSTTLRGADRAARASGATSLLGEVANAVIRHFAVAIAGFTHDDVAERRRRGRARVPRPARARAAPAARPAARPGRAPAARAALPAAADRRVPGHRPDPGRPRGAARVAWIADDGDTTRGPRRRSSPAACSSSATRSSRSTGSGAPTSRRSCTARDTFVARARAAHAQLPHHRARARVGQPRLRRADPAVPRFAARVPRARADPRRRAVGPGGDDARRRGPRRRPRRRRRCGRARPPTSSRPCTRSSSEQWDRRSTASTLAPGPPRRHLHPAPGAHVARIPRERARRRRHPVPRRDELARVRQPRGPRPARRAARRSTTPPTRSRSSARCDRRCSAAATTTSSSTTSNTAASWDVTTPLPDTIPTDHPVAEGDRATSPRCTSSGRGSRRASCSSASSRTGTCSSSALPPGASATSRAASASSSTRPARSGEATAGTLREYLAWALRQGAEGARVVETVLPETDDDAVRIMTVHGAKGLEFPIVIASGMTTRAAPRRGRRAGAVPSGRRVRDPARVRRADRPVRAAPTGRRADGLPREAAPAVRRVHRARDHLVVSAHRKVRKLGDDQSLWTHAELLWHAAQGASFAESVASGASPASVRRRSRSRRRPLAREWQASARRRLRPRAAAGGSSRRRRSRAAPTTYAAAVRGRRSGSAEGAAATSSCRRGTRAATALRSVAPSTRCSRPSTSPPARASTTPRPRRPRPKACSARRPPSRRSPAPRSRAPPSADGERTAALARDLRRGSGRRA